MEEELPSLERRVARSEASVERSARYLEEQRQILARLERNGDDTTRARELLVILENNLALHIDDRGRRRKELEKARRKLMLRASHIGRGEPSILTY